MVNIAHKKSIVAQERVERARQLELTKVQRADDRALKEATKNVKAVDKVKRELTLKKWKDEDNGGLRKKILQCVLEGGPSSKHIPYEGHPILWQNKMNQRIANARLIAKKNRREREIPLPSLPPLLELPWFHGYRAPSMSHSPIQQPQVQLPLNYELGNCFMQQGRCAWP